ncbi:MAG TPA: pirin-like C-terminal cupin domain-containing protein, partial [Ramlibacter sp.]|nr:pirin-like C-terminal cupin domain-containing protein [Ramlibacter sp.]
APLAPPPDSWAAQAEADVAIWTLRMEPGAGFSLPPATLGGTQRTLYFFKGAAAMVGGQAVQGPAAVTLQADVEVAIAAGDAACEFLLLQGRPIGEPVVSYGPFVMNTQQEIAQAMQDYRRTQFGGWKFGDPAPVHGRDTPRFARYPDGREERPEVAQEPR